MRCLDDDIVFFFGIAVCWRTSFCGGRLLWLIILRFHPVFLFNVGSDDGPMSGEQISHSCATRTDCADAAAFAKVNQRAAATNHIVKKVFSWGSFQKLFLELDQR